MEKNFQTFADEILMGLRPLKEPVLQVVPQIVAEEPIIQEQSTHLPDERPIQEQTVETVSDIVTEETPKATRVQKIKLVREDAEIANRLIRAKRIADASGVSIDTVLKEMTSPPTAKRKRISFKKNDRGLIIGADIVEEI